MNPPPRWSIIIAGSREKGLRPEWGEHLATFLHNGDVEVVEVTTREKSSAEFVGLRRLQLPVGTTIPALRAAGIGAAAADLVILTEDFCAPTELWLAAIQAAESKHQDCAVIGGAVTRAGGSASEWALTFVEYGRFPRVGSDGPSADLAGVNLLLRRNWVRDRIGALPSAWSETETHAALLDRGAKFVHVPNWIIIDHQSLSMRRILRSLYQHGRNFGGGRAEGRKGLYRYFRFALTPLVPGLQLIRLLLVNWPTKERGAFLRALPLTLIFLAAFATGEAVGSIAGRGRSADTWQ